MEITKEQKEAIEFIKDLIAWDVRQDLCPNKEECENLEILLNLIEKLQKENEELEEENESLQKTYDDCYCKYKHYKQFESISVQKVKDKIEELKEKEESDYGFVVETLLALQTLQELLEES